MSLLTKHELLLTTREFEFTNNQVAFVRGFIQRKYPAAMSAFIDRVRGLMKTVQTLAVEKLLYGAYYYTPEDSVRYHVSENLVYQDANGKQAYIAVDPVTINQRNIFRANCVEQKECSALELLEGFLREAMDKSEIYLHCNTCVGIKFPDLIKEVKGIVTAHASELVVHECDLGTPENPRFLLDLGHKATQSHHVKLLFDLTST